MSDKGLEGDRVSDDPTILDAEVTDDELIHLAHAITYAQEMGIEDDLRESIAELRAVLSRVVPVSEREGDRL